MVTCNMLDATAREGYVNAVIYKWRQIVNFSNNISFPCLPFIDAYKIWLILLAPQPKSMEIIKCFQLSLGITVV
ncbi:MAG: hypothetical protein GX799_05935 [Crenarchaeota archaeon]|nr:hypothetical protein [Thermoproteota archaeon]